jgi:hypothetical protein
LRIELLKLEHAPLDCDPNAIAYLKRAALNALADAESGFAILQSLASAFRALDASEFEAFLPTISLEIKALEEAAEDVPLYMLD